VFVITSISNIRVVVTSVRPAAYGTISGGLPGAVTRNYITTGIKAHPQKHQRNQYDSRINQWFPERIVISMASFFGAIILPDITT
jgi:hypothetical protein